MMLQRCLHQTRAVRLTSLVVCASIAAFNTTGHAESSASLSVRAIPKRVGYLVAIGIGDYHDQSLMLKYTESDAKRAFDALLNETSGIVTRERAKLITGREATSSRVLSALDDARRWAVANATAIGPRPTIIVYYAGHSTYDEDGDELFLYPVDANRTTREPRLGLAQRIIPAMAAPQADIILIADGCNVGDGLASKLSAKYPNVSVISASKEDEAAFELDELGGGLFTRYFIQALQSPESDLDKDGFISVEEAHHYLYSRVTGDWSGRQHPSVSGRLRHRMALARTPMDSLVLDTDSTASTVLNALSSVDTVQLNGTDVRVRALPGANGPVLLQGNFSGLVQKGVNYLRTTKDEYIFWQEGKKLIHYQNPYKASYAVLVAIDDYERKADPLKRGPTGYGNRGFMVQRAEELKTTLKSLGFDESRVVTRYNERATSTEIEEVLRSFWPGGSRSDADRVLFYFGGHGDAVGRASKSPTGVQSTDASTQLTGFLVTYDFDKSRPTLTSLLMKDLTGRHAENIRAHHMLVALDACHSGLALYKVLGDDTAKDLETFKALSVIRNETDSPARNVLVAGRENQSAVWNDGGIFTRALIGGLSGSADSNRDGLIQFTELATYVKNEVAEKAAAKGVKQQAMDYRLDAFGEGSVLFLSGRPTASVSNPGTRLRIENRR